MFGVFTVGSDKAIEMLFDLFEVRLAVPKGVIGIESEDPYL
jgi:hypothetical protein